MKLIYQFILKQNILNIDIKILGRSAHNLILCLNPVNLHIIEFLNHLVPHLNPNFLFPIFSSNLVSKKKKLKINIFFSRL